ncbi:MAG: homoaconitase [Gemmatimonadota bacterium]|jgi:homoaconitate hydratase
MSQTVVEKIAQAHMTEGPDRPFRAGDVVSLKPRHILTHDNTAAVMEKFRAIGAKVVADPRQPVFAMDHDIQNRSETNLAKYASIKEFASQQGIDFYPPGTGIGHQVMVSMGYVLPGSLVVASDSHANMYGALGALGTPVVRTDAAAVWATGEFWWQIPRTVEVILEGNLPPGATGKDVIITLCGLYNQGEVLNAVVEFKGSGVAGLTMDERFSISNMTTEWGALAGWFPPDHVTLGYLGRRKQLLEPLGVDRISETDLSAWELTPPGPDPDAAYAARIRMDLSQVSPHVAGPDSVQVMKSLAEMEEEGLSIDKAYLVSCVNSRLEDLEAAARVIKGRKVADRVDLYVAAASAEIQEAAEASGAWSALVEAGAHVLPPGCGPCIGLGSGLLEDGEVGISATNRNFKGRMGSRLAQAYLASPAVVAASAVAGRVMGPDTLEGASGTRRSRPELDYHEFEVPVRETEEVEILPGFPTTLSGRLIFVPADNLNTDGIYSKDYTYREGMTPEEMARVVMENYDPSFAELTRRGDILVGGWNFGTGSSREQAATALQAKGIALILAGSFSQTYLRNAYNNGFVCIECPELVVSLKEEFAAEIDQGTLTILSEEPLGVDFSIGAVSYRGETFRFPPLGSVPQGLVVAGGSENLIRKKLGLDV